MGPRVASFLMLPVLAGMLFLANLNTVLGILLIGALVMFVALLAFGTEKLGIAMIFVCVGLAPLDNVRPGGVDFITASDLFLGLGLFLLAPVIIGRHARVPKDYALGAMVLIVASLLASAFGPDPTVSVFVMMRLLVAAIFLPTIFAWWQPSLKVIDWLAGAYIFGQLVSLAFAILSGPEFSNRYSGLSTHVNYFGQTGVLAFALCIYLFHRVKPGSRWLVILAAGLCAYSVVLSGSRAAAIVTVLLVLLYPVVERSAVKGVVVLLMTALAVPIASYALGLTGDNSPFSRFFGDKSTSVSDSERTESLNAGIDRWLAEPILGNGFSNAPLEAHNIYLQVAVVSGVIGLAGFLIIFWSLVRPLFDSHDNPLRRLCYATLGYAAIGMLTNSLWDRFTWVVLAMAFLANLNYTRPQPEPVADPEASGAVPLRPRLMTDPRLRF